MIGRLLNYYDAVQRAFGPELARLDDQRARVKMCERAWHRTMGFAVIVLEAIFLSCAVAVFALSKHYLPKWAWNSPYWGWFVFIVAFVVVVVPSSLFLRARYRRSLRIELHSDGVPICIPCGYDLTGNTSGTCPECGKPKGSGDPRPS